MTFNPCWENTCHWKGPRCDHHCNGERELEPDQVGDPHQESVWQQLWSRMACVWFIFDNRDLKPSGGDRGEMVLLCGPRIQLDALHVQVRKKASQYVSCKNNPLFYQWKHRSPGLEVGQHVVEGDQIPHRGEGGEKEKCSHYQKEFENVKIWNHIPHPWIYMSGAW